MMNVAVIGATGSVGSSVMSVCGAWPEKIRVVAISALHRSAKLQGLAEKFGVSRVYTVQARVMLEAWPKRLRVVLLAMMRREFVLKFGVCSLREGRCY